MGLSGKFRVGCLVYPETQIRRRVQDDIGV